MGSALHANGRPYPHATTEDGKAVDRLTGQKHDKYPELVTSDRVQISASRDISKQQTENIHLTSSSKLDLPGSFGDLSRPVSLSF